MRTLKFLKNLYKTSRNIVGKLRDKLAYHGSFRHSPISSGNNCISWLWIISCSRFISWIWIEPIRCLDQGLARARPDNGKILFQKIIKLSVSQIYHTACFERIPSKDSFGKDTDSKHALSEEINAEEINAIRKLVPYC